MIEVVASGNRWAWRMICDQGRVLAYSRQTYETDLIAADAAKAYRTALWAMADLVDHRQARAI